MDHRSWPGAFVAVVSFCLLIGGCSTMAIEEPAYEVKAEWGDGIELRSYAPILVAETEVSGKFGEAGNRGFRPLAEFIFGRNQARAKVAMTAPVTQERSEGASEKVAEKIAMTAPVTQESAGEGEFLVRFTMPASYTRDTLPVPLDSRVKIRELPTRLLAVVRYSGSWGEDRYEEHRQKLDHAIESRGYRRLGPWVFARYNSPWTLWFLRKNEIQAEVEPR